MTYEQFRVLMVQRMQAITELSNRINWPNSPNFEHPKAGLWARIYLEYAGSLPAGFGNGLWTRQVGNIIVALHARRGASDAEITQTAGRIAKHFQFYAVDTLECLDATIRVVGEDQDWYRINVIIPFRYDQESQL